MPLDFNPREVMPLCTAFIDDVRAHFGDPVGIVAHEGGRSLARGKPASPGRFVEAAPPAAAVLAGVRRDA
jgi:hypothetical protein